MEQNRFKSPVFWAGVASQLLTVLVLFDVIIVSQMEAIKVVIVAVTQLISLFSMSNNPTSKDKY